MSLLTRVFTLLSGWIVSSPGSALTSRLVWLSALDRPNTLSLALGKHITTFVVHDLGSIHGPIESRLVWTIDVQHGVVLTGLIPNDLYLDLDRPITDPCLRPFNATVALVATAVIGVERLLPFGTICWIVGSDFDHVAAFLWCKQRFLAALQKHSMMQTNDTHRLGVGSDFNQVAVFSCSCS